MGDGTRSSQSLGGFKPSIHSSHALPLQAYRARWLCHGNWKKKKKKNGRSRPAGARGPVAVAPPRKHGISGNGKIWKYRGSHDERGREEDEETCWQNTASCRMELDGFAIPCRREVTHAQVHVVYLIMLFSSSSECLFGV